MPIPDQRGNGKTEDLNIEAIEDHGKRGERG